MSKETWLISDTHFGHTNITTFVDNSGNRIRPFNSVEEMDELMVKNWNELVNEGDRVYHLGDFCIKNQSLKIIDRLKGRIVLIKGNHDIFKLKEYLKYFDDIRAFKVFPEQRLICSHIPIHPCQLEHRFKYNVHGHMHTYKVMKSPHHPDERYINLCVEWTDYKPVNFNDLVKGLK